jgi:hypothetical protein
MYTLTNKQEYWKKSFENGLEIASALSIPVYMCMTSRFFAVNLTHEFTLTFTQFLVLTLAGASEQKAVLWPAMHDYNGGVIQCTRAYVLR